MNNLKSVFVSGIAIAVLAGCSALKIGGTSNLSMITAPVTIQKKTPLTDAQMNRWSHLDIVKDTVPGMSVDRAYAEILKKKKGEIVIVGIVDSGVDIEHEDLKSVIWTNKKEIPDNGIDDDKNGYIDDIHGWNFLGDIVKDNLEYERIIANKKIVDDSTYQLALSYNNKKVNRALSSKGRLTSMASDAEKADAALQKHFGKPSYTIDEVKTISSQDPEIAKSQAIVLRVNSFGMTVPEFQTAIQNELDGFERVISGENLEINFRVLVGDNPEDITDTIYGDKNVMGNSADKEHIVHGTHVAGIVAQVRNNKIGGDGIANNVEILSVRAVPDGDEYDKDIALGIRYAVDNGAKVINASFGKDFSPHKEWVYEAIKYAASKDVLIVHAAGNDAKDIDVENNFPNDSDDKVLEFADNMITVGALNYEYGPELVASFSNYGKLNVDVFAPGVNIYASTPDNTYKLLQGTSMAAPNVAGVAALIRSYYPKLSASQVKHILMDSGVAVTMDVVVAANPKDMRSFTTLSQSGKMVNAYNALLMAKQLDK